MPYGRCRSALMAARPLARNRADEPQRAGPAPNAQPPGHGCPDFRALCDRSQQSVEHLPARVTHDREAWSAVASELALQRSLHDDRPAGQRARVSYRWACRKLWRRPPDRLCPTPVSHFVNLWKTEAEREQPVLLANGPRAGKAEALAQPQHGFEALDRAPGRVEGL